MKRIAETAAAGLQWVQPDFTGLYQVVSELEVVATLRVVQGQRGLEGLGEAAEGSWGFANQGLIRRYTAILAGGGEVGRYRGSGDGTAGSVEIPSGKRRYSWARLLENRSWRVTDAAGIQLVDFLAPPRTDVSSRAISARIEVNPAAHELADLPLLVLLTGYLMVRGDGTPTLELEEMESKLGITDLGR